MTDPTAIQLDKGETEQVLKQDDVEGGLAYLVEVSGAPVRFAHRRPQAARGAELRPGQQHKLSNFRGEGLWLHAPDASATVRVRPAGADLDTQPERQVTIESVELGSGIATEDKQNELLDRFDGVEDGHDGVVELLEQIEENTRS